MGRPEGKTFCANALGLEETHVQRTGGKGGEKERERERGLEGSSRGVCGVEVVWVVVLSRAQCDRSRLDAPHQLEPKFPKPQTCQGTVQFER